MPDEVLRFENVWHASDRSKDHVDNISFTLNRGEGLLLSGPEGSGKSQIMDLVMARIMPKAGRIYHDGESLTLQNEDEVEKLRFSVGFVTQTSGLINNLSVLENIVLPLRYHTEMKDDELFAAAEFWIERYELLHKKQARPVALASSESIRVALIRALIVEPRILLLDGIFDGLCPLASRRILELLFEDIQLRRIAFILSTYHPVILDGRDVQFMLLYRGEVVFQGRLADIKNTENAFLHQFMSYKTLGPMRALNETL